MGPARGSQGRREYGFPPDRPSAVFCLGRMGHWNGDRDCEPTRLTVVARMGETGEKLLRVPSAETPPWGDHGGVCCWITRTNYRRPRWTLAFGQHEDRTPICGYEPTREAAMAAFAKSWRRE